MIIYPLRDTKAPWQLKDLDKQIKAGSYGIVRTITSMWIGAGINAYVVVYSTVGRSGLYDHSKPVDEQRPHTAFEVSRSIRIDCDSKQLKSKLVESDQKILDMLSRFDSAHYALPVEPGKRRTKYKPVEWFKQRPVKLGDDEHYQLTQFSSRDVETWCSAVMDVLPEVYKDVSQVACFVMSPISETEYQQKMSKKAKTMSADDDAADANHHDLW